jgi:hypothetical protein
MTLDELKTLLALNGNQRLAHLESEIFANKDLCIQYLDGLSKKYVWAFSLKYHMYRYPLIAVRLSQDRWPEAERLIASNPVSVFYYARDVIKGRWLEAEAIIATDPEYAYRYNYLFGTNI